MALKAFSPALNTPENSFIRGESYYFVDESFTTSVDYLQFNTPLTAAYITPDSDLDAVTLIFWNKDGSSANFGNQFIVTPDSPWVGLAAPVPLNVVPSASFSQVRIVPARSFNTGVATSVSLQMLLYFRGPVVAPLRRSSGNIENVAFLSAGAGTSILYSVSVMGRRRACFSATVTSATVVTFNIYTIQSYESGAISARSLVYTYTSNGSANDGFSFTYNVGASQFIEFEQVNVGGGNAGRARLYTYDQ